MRYEFKPSFDRSIKGLLPRQKANTKAACFAFLDLIETRVPLPSVTTSGHTTRSFASLRMTA